MNEQDKIYRNLVKLLKLFQNRPNHLAKYLIDNIAFTEIFLKLVLESEKLNELEKDQPSFKNIQEMHDFYNIFEETSNKKKSSKKMEEDLNKKLEEYLRLEKYEDAIRIRDYMKKLGFKKENEN